MDKVYPNDPQINNKDIMMGAIGMKKSTVHDKFGWKNRRN